MTISEALSQLDALRPNTFSQRQKLSWLSQLEAMVRRLVTDTYDGAEDAPLPDFDEKTDLQQVLLIPPPFDSAYCSWLEAKLHYANEDLQQYNNAMAVFRTAFDGYKAHYQRTHGSRNTGRFRF